LSSAISSSFTITQQIPTWPGCQKSFGRRTEKAVVLKSVRAIEKDLRFPPSNYALDSENTCLAMRYRKIWYWPLIIKLIADVLAI
jgi:hypothetical protein